MDEASPAEALLQQPLTLRGRMQRKKRADHGMQQDDRQLHLSCDQEKLALALHLLPPSDACTDSPGSRARELIHLLYRDLVPIAQARAAAGGQQAAELRRGRDERGAARGGGDAPTEPSRYWLPSRQLTPKAVLPHPSFALRLYPTNRKYPPGVLPTIAGKLRGSVWLRG